MVVMPADNGKATVVGSFGIDARSLRCDWSRLLPGPKSVPITVQAKLPLYRPSDSHPFQLLGLTHKNAMTFVVPSAHGARSGALVLLDLPVEATKSHRIRGLVSEIAQLASDLDECSMELTVRNEFMDERQQILPVTAASDALSDFMFETLVARRKFRTRNSIDYHTLRTWRSALKPQQVATLKALKRLGSVSLETRAGKEIAVAASSLFGQVNIDCVVPVPCGHSSPDDCLSVKIATSVASFLDKPIVSALELPKMNGSSHPKASAELVGMTVSAKVQGRALLVDDVVTSGRHMELAVCALRPFTQHVFSVGWIGL
jgi:hypothetical protein